MFKGNKKSEPVSEPLPRVLIPHSVSEIQAAISILNDAIASGQLPYTGQLVANGKPQLCLIDLQFMSYDDTRYVAPNGCRGTLPQYICGIDPNNLKSWDDIKAEERTLKEAHLVLAKEEQATANERVERLARELGVKS